VNALIKTLGFSLALIFAFAGVTYVLPQMKGEAPVEKAVDIGALTMDSFVAMGEELFQGKGTCTLCHNKLGRAPDLLAMNTVEVSLERLADARYQGSAADAESYLRESIVAPDALVVAGFGKKGSNDTESPMPAMDQPPAQLSPLEIDAIIAFLQDKDGHPVTVPLPAETDAPAVAAAEQEATTAAAAADSPQAAIAKYGCAACHAILESASPVGPDLKDVGGRLSVAQIRDSIVAPKAEITEGYPPIMPEFPAMTLQELELIVQFLAQQTGPQS
jgi:mono/diheme cytochrome c family protein